MSVGSATFAPGPAAEDRGTKGFMGGHPAQGSLRSRIDAMASMPHKDRPAELPPRPTQVRPSQVRAVLSQAALQMHLPDPRIAVPSYASGPEYDRLRSTLKQLKVDAKEGLGAVGAQLAMESESSRVVEHVNAQVRSVQRAFGVLADTLEDEVGNLRAADSQQWEQLKVHAQQFNEVEQLKTELERTRAELRSTQSAFASFKADEHAALARKVDELAADFSEQRDQLEALQKTHTSERNRLLEEVGSLRRWRTDVASPFIEAAGRSVSNHEQQLERTLPALQKLVEELDARTAKHLPELLQAADLSARRQQFLEEEGGRTSAQLVRLGEAHTENAARLEERLRLFRDESRTESESHELRLRQAAAELEAHAEALRQLSAEGAKARVEAREEADTLATAVRAAQAAQAEAQEKHERTLGGLRSDVRELREQGEQASTREAQTLEGVLNLRTQQNQVSAWMEHVQRELGAAKSEAARNTEQMREMGTELEASKAARASWREELSVIDGKLADTMRSVEGYQAERQALREVSGTMETFKREVRATFEATQHAHNRLRELVDERRAHAGSPTPGDVPGARSALWTSDGAAAARELEASLHAQRRTESSLLSGGDYSATDSSRASGVRFALMAEAPNTMAGMGSVARPKLTSMMSEPPSAAARAERPPRVPAFAWDEDVEPPSKPPPSSVAARSPPLSRGSGATAFTPSLWTTPAQPRSSGPAAVDGVAAGLGLSAATPSSRVSSVPPTAPSSSSTITRNEPRRNAF
jgi:hypothetical protein